MPLLLREAIGGTIRRARTERQRTLRDVSREARVSLGYLSEIERGRKEPSSELLASICEALALSLPDLLDDVAESMRPVRPVRPVRPARPLALAGPIDPALRSAVEEAFAPERGGAVEGAADGAETDAAVGADEVVEEPAEAVDPAELGADDTDAGAEALDRDLADEPAGDAPDADSDVVPDAEAGDDDAGDDDAGDAEAPGTTPTVRLVGLVAVGAGGPVVYAA